MRTRFLRLGPGWALTVGWLVVLGLAVLPVGPVLINGDFEGGFHEQGAGELVIPDGWVLDYRDGDHPWCRPPCKRPEVQPNLEYVSEGRYSVRAFPPAHSRGLFALYQELEVDPGSWWTFSCQARVESLPAGQMATFVGIQPWGGGLFDRQMVWGRELQETREWAEISVTAPAYGSRIRVAIGANNVWPTRNNTVWWDDCRLMPAEIGDCPTCPDCPPCGDGQVDYTRLRDLIRKELVDRLPVRWPR